VDPERQEAPDILQNILLHSGQEFLSLFVTILPDHHSEYLLYQGSNTVFNEKHLWQGAFCHKLQNFCNRIDKYAFNTYNKIVTDKYPFWEYTK
jgi:hypothetical protein